MKFLSAAQFLSADGESRSRARAIGVCNIEPREGTFKYRAACNCRKRHARRERRAAAHALSAAAAVAIIHQSARARSLANRNLSRLSRVVHHRKSPPPPPVSLARFILTDSLARSRGFYGSMDRVVGFRERLEERIVWGFCFLGVNSIL